MTLSRAHLWFWGGIGSALLGFLYVIQGILMPFIAGFLIAYILNPIVYKLERLSIPRIVGTSLMIIGVFLIIFSFLCIAIPFLNVEIGNFLNRIPFYGQRLITSLKPFLEKAAQHTSIENIRRLQDTATGSIGDIFSWGLHFISAILTSGLALANILSLLLISPVVAFYLLKDWPLVLKQIDRIIPFYCQNRVRQLFKEIDRILGAYARGQLVVCGILAVYYSASLLWVGLDFAVIVGVLTGVFAFVPYVGFFLGLLISLALTFAQFSTWSPLGLVVLVYAGGQVLEGVVLTPNLVGVHTGLHPLWIMFALFAGGSLLGFTGVLLALPVSAALGVCVRFAIEIYIKSRFYGKEISPNSHD